MSVTDTPAPVEPPRPTAGVDWAKDDHAVAVLGADGEQLLRFSIAHEAAGLRYLVRRLLSAGVAEVGIERPDGPVVDALRQAGLVVFVIPPGQLKNLRSRYGSAGNKDDRFDREFHLEEVGTTRPVRRDVQSTGQSRKGACQGEDERLVHRGVIAHGQHAILVVADSRQ